MEGKATRIRLQAKAGVRIITPTATLEATGKRLLLWILVRFSLISPMTAKM